MSSGIAEMHSSPRALLAAATVVAALMSAVVLGGFTEARADAAFERFVAGFWPQAKKADITRATYDRAFAGITAHDPEVLEKANYQPEFVKTIGEYLATAVSDARVETGKEMLAAWKPWLDRIEARSGVQRQILVAIWGMESNFGKVLDDPAVVKSVIRSLATLACCDPKRGKFGRSQLIAAMKILQRGDVPANRFTGSWAGAMGHTQFIPTSYLAFSADADGDGKVDIWTNIPDALATAANLLVKNGWRKGETWGYEVVLPSGFNYARVDEKAGRPLADWQKMGVKRATGAGFPHPEQKAKLILPAGARGPAFLILPNFNVIKRYNNATSYALGVGLLSDRIVGAPPLGASWPADMRPLTGAQVEELQRLLAQKGYDPGDIDGKAGPGTRDAIRAYQADKGLPADGNPSTAILDFLKKGG
jgi:membrane-bound lytic murein transglycosylase B